MEIRSSVVVWSIWKMCTHIRFDSGPKHSEDVENGKGSGRRRIIMTSLTIDEL